MKFLYALALLTLLTSQLSKAEPFTLTDRGSGKVYQCGPGGRPVDPNCVKDTAGYCVGHTSFTNGECFDRATRACAKGANAACILSTAEYCNGHTSFTSGECFDRAVNSCSGDGVALFHLLEATKARAAKEALTELLK